MQIKMAQKLLSITAFFAWTTAQAQVVWKASDSCKVKPSGAYAECVAVNKDIALIQAVSPTENPFIKEQSFVTKFSWVYSCAGREDETYVQFGEEKIFLKHSGVVAGVPTPVDSTLIHGFNPDAKASFVRNARGFSTISSTCQVEIKSADTVLSSVGSLREYVKKMVGGLNKVKTVVTQITNASDVTTVQNALFNVKTQFDGELAKLNSQKSDLDLDLEFAESEEAKVMIQSKIDALLLKINDVTVSVDKLASALTKLSVQCSIPEGGVDAPTCTNFLTATVNEINGLKTYFSAELKDQILPWINAEIGRLGDKQKEIADSLTSLKTIIDNV